MNRSLPLILTLDQHGVPHRWVTWQQAVWYYAKERVAWELGREEFTFWGGRCHRTGERSSITANSIIAIRGKALAIKGFNAVPPLNNRELFNRDKFLILANRRILADQMEFLRQHVSANSRIREN